ncbi:MAG: ABC transporter permease [Thermoflexaceae bacterium]|nr:ABC transporter permease [Thermoflexaceae bacterium]
MIRKLIWNDVKKNKLLSAVTTAFMAISAMLTVLTVVLFTNLLGAIDDLMLQAKTPDFLQMHAGEMNRENIIRFAEEDDRIREWQICLFLNLENSAISLNGHSLADSTQDNGLCVQGEKFDYLLDMKNKMPQVMPGEVYVPVCYRLLYDLNVGDIMEIGTCKLTIAGFIRDSQMNSMMSSSKRFLVNEEDYESIKGQGEEEYLIEFMLEEGADFGAFGTAYAQEGLPANGPTITKPLIRMMNALSDGMMILVIFLVSIVVLLISMLCIRFILNICMEKDKKEVGMLKALGIGKREIRQLYFSKYIFLSVCGAFLGLLTAYFLKNPLVRQMQELYGVSKNGWQTGILAVMAVLVAEGIMLLSIWCILKKTEKLSVLEALFTVQKEEKQKERGQYLFIGFVVSACTFLMLVPQNLYSTLSSNKFVTYMGIGDGEIRIDVRQTEDIRGTTQTVIAKLENDVRVEKYALLQTKSYPVFLSDGTSCNLTVEEGNHTIFPVSYVKGRAPEDETELSLSSLNAEELGLSVGDSLKMLVGGRKVTYTICGIYSDITNGGKTAKAGIGDNKTPVMWSIVYVSLKPSVSREQWLDEYDGSGVKAVDIADYVAETYGQTLQEIKLASKVSAGTSVVIIFAVITLFLRLIVEKNRYSVSLYKALGFTNARIQKIYMVKGLLSAVAGVTAGMFFGEILGEGLCGMIIKSFGADGFRFVTDWEKVLFLIPAICLITAGIAVWTGILEIKKVKAFECCMRKE